MKNVKRKKLRKGIRQIKSRLYCDLSLMEHAILDEKNVRRSKRKKKRPHTIKWLRFLNLKLLVVFVKEVFKAMF